MVVARRLGGRIWLTTAVEDRGVSLRALAFDVATGREVVNVEVFRTRAPAARHPKNTYASPSAVVDGDRVYVHFGTDGTAALTTAGEVVWKTRLHYESQHGAGGSPVVYGDLLIVNCDGGDAAFVVALDKRTGKTRWKTSRRQPWAQAYTTPLVIRVGDRDQVVSVGAFRAAAYDPQIGQGNLARQLRRRLLERAAAGLRPRARLHRHGILPAGDHRRPARRHRRRVEDARRRGRCARGAPLTPVAARRRRRALPRDRRRHRHVPGRPHGRRPSGSSASTARSRPRRSLPTAASTFSPRTASRR